MRNSYKVLTAVAVAGLAFAGGSAFTGTGLSTAGAASTAQFVGGTVSQSVTGATLSNIAYGYTDTTQTSATSVNLTFQDDLSNGKAASIVLNAAGTPVSADCALIVARAATCNFAATSVDTLAVTVANP